MEKEDVDSKRKRECPGNNNEGTNGCSKSGFLLDRFQKTQGHQKNSTLKNPRAIFSQKFNVSDIFEASINKLKKIIYKKLFLVGLMFLMQACFLTFSKKLKPKKIQGSTKLKEISDQNS